MKVVSQQFEQFKPIPEQYTCKGANISVPLSFLEIPKDTVSYAIIVDDPDAPNGVFTHWVAWNIPADTQGILENKPAPREGKNSYNVIGYKGPCPPPGKTHRYFFRVFALDTLLDLPQGSDKAALEKAMEGHILEKAELVGTFQR